MLQKSIKSTHEKALDYVSIHELVKHAKEILIIIDFFMTKKGINSLMKLQEKINIVWLKRDLRTFDHKPLNEVKKNLIKTILSYTYLNQA